MEHEEQDGQEAPVVVEAEEEPQPVKEELKEWDLCRFCRHKVPKQSLREHFADKHRVKYDIDFLIEKCFDSKEKSGPRDQSDHTEATSLPSQRDKLVKNNSNHGTLANSQKNVHKIPWYSGCQFQCQICSKLYFYKDDLISHVKKRHFSTDEYLEKFKNLETKLVFMKCRVCLMTIPRHYNAVWTHINKDHGLSLFEYQEKYNLQEYEVAVSPIAQNGCDAEGESSDEEIHPTTTKDPETSVSLKRVITDCKDGQAEVAVKKPKITIEPVKGAANSSSSPSKGPPSVYITPVRPKPTLQVMPKLNNSSLSITKLSNSASKLWFMGCEYRCLIGDCNKTLFDEMEMLKHMRTVHEHHARHPADFADSVESNIRSFTCEVCQQSIDHQRSSISKHLESHNMSILRYTEMFHKTELKAVSEEIKNEPPSLTITPASLSVPTTSSGKNLYERWSKGACKFSCGVCKFNCHCSAEFWRHVSTEHKLSIADYKAGHGNPCIVYKELQCLGCNKLLRNDPGTLANHASNAHNLSLEEFYNTFFKATDLEVEESQDLETLSDNEEDREKLDDEARAWADQCNYDCRICGNITYMNYGSLFDHIRSKHGISVDGYKSEYGDMATKKVMHHCRLCQVEFLHTSAIMRKHFKRCHELTLSQYYMDYIRNSKEDDIDYGSDGPSDDGEPRVVMDAATTENFLKWKFGCEYKCKMCDTVLFSWSHLNKHLRCNHETNADEYRESFGILMTKKSFHKCFICRSPIIQEPKNLRQHMQKRHSMGLDEYYLRFMCLKGGKKQCVTSPPKMTTSTQAQILKSSIYANWKYACRYDCKLCSFSTRHSSDFSTHMSGRHGMSLAEYTKQHGRAMTLRVQHECKICGSSIIQQPQSMKGHVTMHALTLEEYFMKYVMGEIEMEESEGNEENGNLEDENYSIDETTQASEDVNDGDYYTDLGDGSVEDDSPEESVDQSEEDKLHTKYLTYDEWRHACVYTCKICNHSSKHHADIYSHMISKHDMSIKEYTEKYGKPMTKEVYHNCQLCGKDLLQQSKNIKKHVKSHNISLEMYFETYIRGKKASEVGTLKYNDVVEPIEMIKTRPSSARDRDDCSDFSKWKNACRFQCRVCNYSTKAYFTFNFHVKDKHKLSIPEYTNMYGKPMTHKVYHQCIICGAGFLQIAKTISRHLQLHGIPMEEYYYTYVAEEQPGSKGQGSSSVADPLKSTQVTSAPAVKKPLQKVSKSVRLSKCLSKSPYLTFCWNQCKETCGMCNQVFSTSATLHKHIRFIHNVDLEWYRSHHITAVDNVTTTCLICNTDILLTQKSMETHLRTNHFTSLMNYEEQFRVELSEQFVSLQKMRQSSDTNEDQFEMAEDQEDSNEEHYNYPSIADMIETEIQVGDEETNGDDDNGETESIENDEVEEIDDDYDDNDGDGMLEPEQIMIEGNEDMM